MLPLLILQLFGSAITRKFGVDAGVADEVGVYLRWMLPQTILNILLCHLSTCFVNMGYERSTSVIALVSGMGVDIACTYLFISVLEYGTFGAALVQFCVRATALLMYLAFIAWHGVSQTMLGVSLTWPRFCRKGQNNQMEALLLSELGTGETEHDEKEDILSRPEVRLFFSLGAPQLASFFSGWLVYEIQIILLGKIPGVEPEALAAGVG
jgi:hypothetical protein